MKDHDDDLMPKTVERDEDEDMLVEEVVELRVESVDEVCDGKTPESSFMTVNLGSETVEMVVVEEGVAGKDEDSANGQICVTEVVNTETGEANGRGKEESLHPTDDAQEATDGYGVVNETIVKENEALDSSNISEPSTTINPGSENVDLVVVEEGLASEDEGQIDVPVDPNLVSLDDQSLPTEMVNSTRVEGDDVSVPTKNVDEHTEVDKKSNQVSFDSTTELMTNDVNEKAKNGNGVGDSNLVVDSLSEPKTGGATDATEEVGTETGLTNNEEIIEQPTVSVQEVSYGNGVMDDETGKTDEVLDSSRNPEALTTVNLVPEEVNSVTPVVDVAEHPEFSYEEVEMVGGEDAGMDIDEVLGWKDEILEIDVVSGAGKDEHFNVAANSEAEQGLPESSTLGDSGKDEPVLIRHQEENKKSRELIVYGRRANVEVPLYDALDGSRSLVLEDENLDIETDSEEYDEYMQEEEENVVGQSTDLENGSPLSLHQLHYFRPPRNEGEFAVSDLVWGKVRSHPWWPGQIIDPSHASQKAMKYHKKDCYLVAYFGDHSFAWNDSSVLKPFRANFSQIEKLSNLEAFKVAVECSLEEVTRRVELGLACSCVPRDMYKKIEYQVIENGGVRQKSTKRHGSDESASVSSFEPDKLVDYVRLLAQFPGEGNNLDLAMAKAQLSSYGRYKGHRDLPVQFFEDMLEEDAPIREGVETADKNSEKFENNLIETANPNKEINLSDITDDAPESGGVASRSVSSSGLKKRKTRNSISNGSVKKQNRQPDKATTPLVSTPKPSFKIGELIQRAASQLTGPPSALKSNSDANVVNGQHADQVVGYSVSLQIPEKPEMEASVAEMISQLHSIAQDPMKDYTFLHTTFPFFYNRRGDVYSKSLKKSSPIVISVNDDKTKESNEIDPEEFDFDFQFDDLNNDSYWTDRIIQNPSDAPLLQDHQNGDIEYQVVASEQEKPAKRRRQSNKKQVSRTKRVKVEVKEEEEPEIVRRRRENLATEVVLNFAEGSSFPSVVNLNKIFRRFGPLMESETEVDSQGGRARVVFKKCSDAEVAHSSAGKFKIFGSIDVKYELNYTPLVSYKPSPLPLLHDPMDAN